MAGAVRVLAGQVVNVSALDAPGIVQSGRGVLVDPNADMPRISAALRGQQMQQHALDRERGHFVNANSWGFAHAVRHWAGQK